MGEGLTLAGIKKTQARINSKKPCCCSWNFFDPSKDFEGEYQKKLLKHSNRLFKPLPTLQLEEIGRINKLNSVKDVAIIFTINIARKTLIRAFLFLYARIFST